MELDREAFWHDKPPRREPRPRRATAKPQSKAHHESAGEDAGTDDDDPLEIYNASTAPLRRKTEVVHLDDDDLDRNGSGKSHMKAAVRPSNLENQASEFTSVAS